MIQTAAIRNIISIFIHYFIINQIVMIDVKQQFFSDNTQSYIGLFSFFFSTSCVRVRY